MSTGPMQAQGVVDKTVCAAVVTAQYGGEVYVFPCASDQPLLDGALAAGLTVPYSCREGHCGACMVVVSRGETVSKSTSGLSRRDRAKGYVLACQARPCSAEIFITYDS